MLTASDTAYAIAAVRAEEADLPVAERLFDDPFARLFHAAGAHAADGTARFLALPCFREGVRLRTRFIDDFVRNGLAEACDQIVILGAGFDARGLRIAEIAVRGAAVYEVDLAAVLEKKRAILAAAKVAMPPFVAHVACDFADDFEATLARDLEERGFRRGRGALFVWEGVIGYIDALAIDRSLRFMADAGGPGARVVFTFGMWSFEPETVAERTRRAGFTTCEDLGTDDVWRRYLSSEPPPQAFAARIGMASVGSRS
jgi:methyltransferase (TIGR00027 family)